MNTNIKKKLSFGIAWNILDKLITQVGYLAVTLFIARVIGPDAFGLIGMLSIFMLLSDSIINNGFSQALIQRSHHTTEDDYSTIFFINIICGILIYISLFFLAPYIASFYKKSELVDISRVLFLVIIINSFSVVVRAKLTIIVDFKSQTISNAIATILSSIVSITLVIKGYGYWSFVYLILLKSLFTNIALYYFSHWVPSLIFNKTSFNRLFKFGSNLMLAGIISTIVNNLYIILIGRYFTSNNVGYFTQSANLTNFLSQFISSTLQNVTYPILTSIKEEKELLISLYKELLSITMLVSLPIFIGFASITKPFILLFLGQEWLPAVPIIQILCLARLITPISVINMNILNAIGRSDLFLKVDLIKLPITLTALIISIQYGILGVSLAILTTTLISFFINAYYPYKFFNFGAWNQLKSARNYIFSSILMYIIISNLTFNNLWIELILKISLGFSLYFCVLILLKDRLIMTSIKKIKKKILKNSQNTINIK